jgi:hypothetical protein
MLAFDPPLFGMDNMPFTPTVSMAKDRNWKAGQRLYGMIAASKTKIGS